MKEKDHSHNFELCKVLLRHAMFDIPAEKPSQVGWALWVKCERCGTIRKDVINLRGDIVYRKYVYPDGYRSHVTGMTPADRRVVILRANKVNATKRSR